MLHRRQHCLLFPCNWLCSLRRRQQGSKKFKIIQLSLSLVLVTALITYFSVFPFNKSIYDHETRSQLIEARNSGSTFSRFNDKPSSGSGALSLSSVAPTLNWTSGSLKPIPSSAEPAILPDFKSWKTTPQHKTTLITKTVCTRHYPLLILVSSAPANFERRYLIRQTWGADNSTVPQWKTYFLLGQTRDPARSDLLKKENSIYGDMIRADYYEHYWNQSLKIQMAFEWAARYCEFSYLLKADDDVLVNAKRLLDVLHLKSTPKKGLYMGKRHRNPIVQRSGKWRVSYEEYRGTRYPDFCSGAGFVMSYDVIESAVPLFDVIKPFRVDDVYVGMLAEKLGVRAMNHKGFVILGPSKKCNFFPNTLVQHQAIGECLIRLFMNHKNL
ncbi:beta-1,3-galactosyltransferase 5-like [Orbicella faveolata]|uniref:beta-1,3-galactosyltransferase 5-like n=1 Tax=Orbicella faveolata TaxID=48498 RepID=UPI0009E387D7|nr:beta-1,3-galactosyltransferase 5-like [Orbicella faveolata]